MWVPVLGRVNHSLANKVQSFVHIFCRPMSGEHIFWPSLWGLDQVRPRGGEGVID